MNYKKIIILSGLAIVMMTTLQTVFADEVMVTPTAQEVVISNQQSSSEKESDLQWAWGEVTNLDNQANNITLKYLDYETDQEKELVLAIDEKTTFENIKDFNEVKLGDTLSIDYITGADNKNIAKNISFEKPDASSVSASEVENSELVTDVAQPVVQSEIPVDSSIAVNEAPASVVLEPVPAVQDQAQ